MIHNPLVLKITNAKPALVPPIVRTNKAEMSTSGPILKGELIALGDASKLKVGFQYREYAGFVEELYSDEWKETKILEV